MSTANKASTEPPSLFFPPSLPLPRNAPPGRGPAFCLPFAALEVDALAGLNPCAMAAQTNVRGGRAEGGGVEWTRSSPTVVEDEDEDVPGGACAGTVHGHSARLTRRQLARPSEISPWAFLPLLRVVVYRVE